MPAANSTVFADDPISPGPGSVSGYRSDQEKAPVNIAKTMIEPPKNKSLAVGFMHDHEMEPLASA